MITQDDVNKLVRYLPTDLLEKIHSACGWERTARKSDDPDGARNAIDKIWSES